MRLDAERTTNALGFAACFTFGNVECNIARTMETQFELGLSARNGLVSSALAKQHGRAAPTSIEGKAGFLNLFAGTTEFAQNVTAGLGREFEILRVTFKRYPTSMIAQSPIYIAARLAREERLDPDAIEEIVVELDPFEAEYPGPGRRQHEEPADRGSGTAQGVAAALVYGQASRSLLRRRDDARINRLLEKMSIKGSSDVAPQCARLTVQTAGKRLLKEIKDGSRNHVFSFDDTVDLVRDLQPEMRVSAATLEEIIDTVQRLETVESIRPLMGLVAKQER
jgi:2-methylcitrate dehydratase PrpD